ncbi:MAG: UDP-N-acetylglucosamine 2-epimerase (non-hydrolyzing) [Chromatiales bacterium]|jgi:UDP-N-acetylglucosamine 2-epimerase (non-hydrolysing)
MKSILCVVGARPNFMKIAPIIRAFKAEPNALPVRLVHTGQHYDEAMKDSFFRLLGIPEPDVDLEVGSGSHAVQTAEIMKRFEPVLDTEDPAAVLVVGDVNSTIACALVAVKKGVPVIHVEAGLRSNDRQMPEEINRVLTDQISDLLFTTEKEALANLQREGIAAERVHFVGNVMIDTLRYQQQSATASMETLAQYDSDKQFDFATSGFALLTMHRPSNVDNAATLESLLTTLAGISKQIPLVFPVHPRTAARIKDFGLDHLIDPQHILRVPPLGYGQLLGLMQDARMVLTDSGGIQEETTALGVPCITLRENTERPITVTEGTNVIVGTDPDKIRVEAHKVLNGEGKGGRVPEFWDGRAAERIKDVLLQVLY